MDSNSQPPLGVRRRRGWALLVLLTMGCQSQEEPSTAAPPPKKGAEAARAARPVPLPIAEKPAGASISGGGLSDLQGWLRGQPDAETVQRLPRVVLSQQHERTCFVKVGETPPALRLETLDGKPTTLSGHYGPRGTIVVFWQARQPMSVEQIRRLQLETVQRFRAAGLQIVTIAVESDVQQVRQLLDLAGLRSQSVNLLDADGSAFNLVASERLPRTYLLDRMGAVQWFDLEYSRGTRIGLEQAVLFYLQQLPN